MFLPAKVSNTRGRSGGSPPLSPRSAWALEQLLQSRPDRVQHQSLRLARRMDAVGLKVASVFRETFEEKRNKRGFLRAGELSVGALELFGVRRAVVGWQTHSHEQDLRLR